MMIAWRPPRTTKRKQRIIPPLSLVVSESQHPLHLSTSLLSSSGTERNPSQDTLGYAWVALRPFGALVLGVQVLQVWCLRFGVGAWVWNLGSVFGLELGALWRWSFGIVASG